MLIINPKDIILANIIAAILHAETTDKIISKEPVLTLDLYNDLAFSLLNASSTYMTVNQYLPCGDDEKDAVQVIENIYKKYDIIDLTNREVVLKYIDDFLNEHCKMSVVEYSEGNSTKKCTCYIMDIDTFNNLPMHYQLFVSHTEPKCAFQLDA